MKLRRTLCACCLAAVVLPHSVAAQNYSFTNIADSTGPFSFFGLFGDGPRLNNSGTVSFRATLDAGGDGVYRSDGVVTTPIADNNGPSYQSFGDTDINDAGQVAFVADLGDDFGIFRGDGLSMTKIVDALRPTPFAQYSPRLNNAGSVTFFKPDDPEGQEPDIPIEVLVGSGGNLTTYANSDGPLRFFIYRSYINNLGTVAFFGLFDAGGEGIFRSTGGTIVTAIDSSGPYLDFGSPALNDSGIVAIGAERDAGGAEILLIDGSTVNTVADTDGPYDTMHVVGLNTLQVVGLNNAGDVAFVAGLDGTDQLGIFTGPDPVADKVIGDGDLLFGSTVDFFTRGDGPNDAGQIVFRYSLDDGRNGIALATPIAGLAGDYNHDDVVDAADYIVWRKDVISGNLATDGNDGFDPDDYNVWRTHFGETLGSGAHANSLPANEGVPEPNAFALMCFAAAIVAGTLRVP